MLQETDSIQKAVETVPATLSPDSVEKEQIPDFTSKKSHWEVKVDSVLMPDAGEEVKAEVKPPAEILQGIFLCKGLPSAQRDSRRTLRHPRRPCALHDTEGRCSHPGAHLPRLPADVLREAFMENFPHAGEAFLP